MLSMRMSFVPPAHCMISKLHQWRTTVIALATLRQEQSKSNVLIITCYIPLGSFKLTLLMHSPSLSALDAFSGCGVRPDYVMGSGLITDAASGGTLYHGTTVETITCNQSRLGSRILMFDSADEQPWSSPCLQHIHSTVFQSRGWSSTLGSLNSQPP